MGEAERAAKREAANRRASLKKARKVAQKHALKLKRREAEKKRQEEAAVARKANLGSQKGGKEKPQVLSRSQKITLTPQGFKRQERRLETTSSSVSVVENVLNPGSRRTQRKVVKTRVIKEPATADSSSVVNPPKGKELLAPEALALLRANPVTISGSSVQPRIEGSAIQQILDRSPQARRVEEQLAKETSVTFITKGAPQVGSASVLGVVDDVKFFDQTVKEDIRAPSGFVAKNLQTVDRRADRVQRLLQRANLFPSERELNALTFNNSKELRLIDANNRVNLLEKPEKFTQITQGVSQGALSEHRNIGRISASLIGGYQASINERPVLTTAATIGAIGGVSLGAGSSVITKAASSQLGSQLLRGSSTAIRVGIPSAIILRETI